MPTLQNARKHDLVSSGVTLRPGPNEVTDKQLVALGDDPQFVSWIGLGWLGIVQYSEADLRALQEHARLQEQAAEAARKAAAAKTVVTEQRQVTSQRENGLAAEIARAKARVAAADAAAPKPPSAAQPAVAQKPAPQATVPPVPVPPVPGPQLPTGKDDGDKTGHGDGGDPTSHAEQEAARAEVAAKNEQAARDAGKSKK